MRNTSVRSEGVTSALASARYEVLPTSGIEAKLTESVPVTTTLTVTASPGKGLDATLDCTERLARLGYPVVPHLAARMVRDRDHLVDIVERLRALDVSNVFVPAGDANPPAGDYAGSLDLLRHLTELGRPFEQVGITGYPESHPSIADDVTVQSMWDKREHATYVVSNMCFDAAQIRSWVARLRTRSITLPVLIGMPGPVESAKLLSVATKIGVGESTRFLAKNASVFTRLAAPGGYRPERMLDKLAELFADPVQGAAGLHLYTFNQVAETHRWRQTMLERAAG
ncbi:MAG TPA: methylenetetrahydrofolate reductase [Nocardioidaceae bacterium]|jgi:methylenetetrahydrofolate reductase (NADPH)|nr:methylenetetrahydrofolate reductase [Nocardioidaceae bacterium]